MTTITYRDGIMAGDMSIVNGSRVIRNAVRKIRKTRDGWLVGMCGDMSWGQRFLEWAETRDESRWPREEKNDQWSNCAILVSPDGALYMYEDDTLVTLHCDYMAIGSGGNVAVGAMHAGASAVEAIRASSCHDAYTGDAICVEKIDGTKIKNTEQDTGKYQDGSSTRRNGESWQVPSVAWADFWS